MKHAPDAARSDLTAWRDALRADPLACDPHAVALLTDADPDAVERLRPFARACATTLDDAVRRTNEAAHLPRLQRWDGLGRRTEAVVFDPAYHAIGRAVYRTGVIADYATPGRERTSLAVLYQLAQDGEAGHCCPLACTAGLVKILQHAEAQGHPAPEPWLERLLDPDYDQHAHGSQFLTEVQGGSDVGANAVIARPTHDPDWFTLHGEKWFCSVVDAQLFLVSARLEGGPDGTRGVHAFVVPRQRDGAVNGFAVRRLKDKLGTRSMASAEIDFEGALGWRVASFRDVVELVLNTSRLYNAVCGAGMMQRAWREASAYAVHRHAFGQPIGAFPAVARIVARLHAEAAAARASTFWLADLADRMALGQATEAERAAWRFGVNVNKYWVSEVATGALRDGIEVLGGNGAIESFSVLPRLLRDSLVTEAWEGGHNVLCAQVLKDAHRLRLHEAFFATIEAATGDPLTEHRQAWAALLERPPAEGSWWVRDHVDALRAGVQAALLRAEATRREPELAEHLRDAADHVQALGRRGFEAAADPGFADRVRRLAAPAPRAPQQVEPPKKERGRSP